MTKRIMTMWLTASSIAIAAVVTSGSAHARFPANCQGTGWTPFCAGPVVAVCVRWQVCPKGSPVTRKCVTFQCRPRPKR